MMVWEQVNLMDGRHKPCTVPVHVGGRAFPVQRIWLDEGKSDLNLDEFEYSKVMDQHVHLTVEVVFSLVV